MNKKATYLLGAIALILGLSSCEMLSSMAGVAVDMTAFNASLLELPPIVQPAELASPVLVSDGGSHNDGTYTTTTKTYKAAPGYTEMIAMDPTTDVIYPGALIKGESISTGMYTPIVFPRKPLTLSISLENIEGDVARTIDDPKLSTIRQAVKDILAQKLTGATPAQMSYEMKDIYSEQQLSIALAASYESAVLKVSGSFNFNKSDVRSRTVAKFMQKYYSIDIDIPAQPADFFKAPVALGSLGSYSPMYVSTVTYGRLALFTVESTKSSTEVKAALQAAYDAAIKVGGTLDVTSTNVMNASTISVYISGGSGEGAVQSISGFEAFKTYITSGGNYTKDSPGAPISYKLRYLKDNAIGKIILSSEYTVNDASLNPPPPVAVTKTVHVKWSHISNPTGCTDNADIYGKILWHHNWPNEADEVGTFLNTGDTQYLSDVTSDGIDRDVVLTKTYSEAELAKYSAGIRISQWLTDEDTGSDESMGANGIAIGWSEISKTPINKDLESSNNGCTARSTFQIWQD
jgi:hypothetical protein